MREILTTLFPCIVILYLIESIDYIHHYQVLISSLFGSRFRIRKSGFHIVKLSPMSCTVFSHNLPISFTRKGLFFLKHNDSAANLLYKRDDFNFISYSDMNNIETDGKVVKVNGKNVAKTPSLITAQQIFNLLKKLRNIEPSNRFTTIQAFFRQTSDLSQISRLKVTTANYFFYMRVLCSFLFINVFFLLPVALYTPLYAYIKIHFIFVYMLVSYVAILFLTYRTHKRIFEKRKKERAYALLSLFFLPVGAMHVMNYLTRDMFSRFDYVAIAYTFLPSEVFKTFIRKELHIIEYTRNQINRADWSEFWDLRKTFLHLLIEKKGFLLEDIFSSPTKRDELATSYCPICLAEYISDFGICSDCGIELEKFQDSVMTKKPMFRTQS